jgi:hypothetical protein
MKTILVTGGTGLIGKKLCGLLQSKGYKVLILSRSNSKNPTIFEWNLEQNYIAIEAIINTDYIIHLAGESIADKRWTAARKQAIINSRVQSTNLLFNTIKAHNPNLKGFIAASGVGFYGATTSQKVFTETDEVGNDFLAYVCQLWETSSNQFNTLNIRTVIFRTGIVLSKKGGALEKITRPIKLGVGSPIGSGKQYVPWIHIDDLCNMYLEAIENIEYSGIYNAVAPEHITNSQLTKSIAKQLHKKIWLPNVPSFVLKLFFGKMAVILLEGSKVSSDKIAATKFEFKYTSIKKALVQINS